VDALGTLTFLNAIKDLKWENGTRFYQASTSELFGSSPPPQSEATPFHPRSPYAVAKLYAYWITVNYREAFGIFAVNGVLFNHESKRRHVSFVTRKITRSVGQYYRNGYSFKGIPCLVLGNLDAKRDWGHAQDYVEAMWLMLQQEKPVDLVIGTGETHSIREFVVKAFQNLPVPKDIIWEGQGLQEVGKIEGEVVVKVDAKYFRPSEVENLQADPRLAFSTLHWKPPTTFDSLVTLMVQHDLTDSHHSY
jgi:GDPmannose 4,6-dehydratase